LPYTFSCIVPPLICTTPFTFYTFYTHYTFQPHYLQKHPGLYTHPPPPTTWFGSTLVLTYTLPTYIHCGSREKKKTLSYLRNILPHTTDVTFVTTVPTIFAPACSPHVWCVDYLPRLDAIPRLPHPHCTRMVLPMPLRSRLEDISVLAAFLPLLPTPHYLCAHALPRSLHSPHLCAHTGAAVPHSLACVTPSRRFSRSTGEERTTPHAPATATLSQFTAAPAPAQRLFLAVATVYAIPISAPHAHDISFSFPFAFYLRLRKRYTTLRSTRTLVCCLRWLPASWTRLLAYKFSRCCRAFTPTFQRYRSHVSLLVAAHAHTTPHTFAGLVRFCSDHTFPTFAAHTATTSRVLLPAVG